MLKSPAEARGVMQAIVLPLLLLGYTSAVPFYGDFMHHHALPPRFLPPITPAPAPQPFARFVEPLAQSSSEGQPRIWRQFANDPFRPVYSNFDVDAEFVPLERHHPLLQARTEGGSHVAEKPFEVDVLTSDVGGSQPGVFFQQSFPFFGQDFFNSFSGFGIGGNSQHQPWWQGPNVCIDKTEEEETATTAPNKEDSVHAASLTHPDGENHTKDDAVAETTSDGRSPPFGQFGQFHFSVNSCAEKPNKYVCTKILNQNGKKKTMTSTSRCCRGYGRARNADHSTPCDKIEIKNIAETAADMGAKEFVATAKSSGLADTLAKTNVTVFMPIDSAFASYNEQHRNDINNVEAKEDGAMRQLYLRHIVDGEISLYDVANDQMLKTQQAAQSIRINRYQLPTQLATEPFSYTANCVPIEAHDQSSEQGLVHTLGGVMRPVTMTVMDMIRQRADMSIMRTVLENTKLSAMLEGDKPVTIFVPTDDAFDKLEPHLRRALKEGKGCATNILKNHILELTFCSAASVPGAKTTAFNMLGDPLRFNRSKAAIENSEVSDLLSQRPVIINGKAQILEADIMGRNGVMHVIDTILPTPSALPLSTLMGEKNTTIFKRLVEAAGLDNQFDDMENATIFAPTDKALQDSEWSRLLTESPESLKNNAELAELLNYHVVQPMIKTCDLKEQIMPTAAKRDVRINLYSTHTLFSDVMNRATVNCARLVHFDDESCGSVLHQVDKVLTPPKLNLLQMLEANPDYSKFLKLVHAANLTSLLSNADEGFTVLVPKNDVFTEFEDLEKTLENREGELEDLVKTHIVNDVVCCAGIIPTKWPFVRSIESLNGAHLRITRDRRPKIENAGVTKCDVLAVNGIIHEINDIVAPAKRPTRPPHPLFQPYDDSFGDIFA